MNTSAPPVEGLKINKKTIVSVSLGTIITIVTSYANLNFKTEKNTVEIDRINEKIKTIEDKQSTKLDEIKKEMSTMNRTLGNIEGKMEMMIKNQK